LRTLDPDAYAAAVTLAQKEIPLESIPDRVAALTPEGRRCLEPAGKTIVHRPREWEIR